MPVGISIGKSKFRLGHAPVYMREAAPWGLRDLAHNDDFSERCQSRLEGIGIEVFQKPFAEISQAHDERGLVFLCFDPVGAFCQRRVLARWIEEKTGQCVPEPEPPTEASSRPAMTTDDD
jgi:hypothetical protein